MIIEKFRMYEYYKSILAGILIATGGYVNMKLGALPGAVLFSVGLIAVIQLRTALYTGMVSNKESYKELQFLFMVLFFNFIGALFLGILSDLSINNREVFIAAKMQKPLLQVFFDAIICGICVSIAVKIKDNIVTILAVTVFVITGGEHCVADVFYFANRIDINMLIFLFIVIAGNTVGGLLFTLHKTELQEYAWKNKSGWGE